MNYLDIIILIPLLYGLVKGFSNGIIKEIIGLTGLIVGVYIAINFSFYLHPRAAELLKGYAQFVPIISFATLFVFSVLVIRLLGYFLDKITKALALGIISKILGAVFGVLKVLVIFGFLMFFIKEYKLIDTKTQSDAVLLGPIEDVAGIITPKLNKHKNTFLEKVEKKTKEAKKKLEKKINTQ
tara:strand:+ start:86 stop:634 length:549 start_codon:yes stop_codon:yes gene_type:complete